MNGEQLGVRPASKIFVDDADGIAKLTLSPTRPILKPSSASAVRLSAIELLYVFRTRNTPVPQQPGHSGAQSNAGLAAAADPFSPHAFLPLVAALDRTVDKFAEYHLVRRYPLIFGPWRERFDAEVAASAKIARAIADIIARSPHAQFRKKARRLLKAMQRNCAEASAASRHAVHGLLQPLKDHDIPPSNSEDEGEMLSTLDHSDILCQSLERLFKTSSKPIRYKVSYRQILHVHSAENFTSSISVHPANRACHLQEVTEALRRPWGMILSCRTVVPIRTQAVPVFPTEAARNLRSCPGWIWTWT
ncbi:hypothetical protein OH77DRAFT_1423379 [Trametes cingulata]|nr:hypothetical protein OH77DRAFT_1423379 [Trametes cingulata]